MLTCCKVSYLLRGKPFTLREALFQSVMNRLKIIFYKKELIFEFELRRRGVFRLFRRVYDIGEHTGFMTDLFILIVVFTLPVMSGSSCERVMV